MTKPTQTSVVRHPVEQLAEEFVTRIRRGERPSLSEYVRQYPEVADELADIVQALLLLEDLAADGDIDNDAAPVPETLGEYRLLHEIGRGGMGIVYEAEQSELGRRVALKVLPAAALLRPHHLERFRREARAAARLHHTNIIPVYGVGSDNGVYYFAMQYIPGLGLDVVLQQTQSPVDSQSAGTWANSTTWLSGSGSHGPSVRYRRVADIGGQIAGALAHAHAHGVLHRDVKPANIVLDEAGVAWLGDFGLAQLADDIPLTSTGGFVGTLRFLAPERLRGDATERSDIYSLGASLYELVTLRPMFAENDRTKLLHQVAHEEPVAPRHIDSQIPHDLETIILKAIAKHPEDRYQSAAALADDLARFLTDRPVTARRISPWEMMRRWVRRNPVTAGLLATIFVCLAGGLGTTRWQWQRAESNLIAKTDALNQSQQSAAEADKQKDRAQSHSRRAFLMLEKLMSELTKTSEGQAGADTHRFLLAQALKVHQDYLNENSVEPAERIDVARLAILAGDLNRELQDREKAERYYKMALELVEPEASDANSPAQCRELKARAMANCGSVMRGIDAQREEADRLSEQSLELFRELVKTNPTERIFRRNFSISLKNLALQARLDGQGEKAVALSREAVDVCKSLMAEDPDDWTTQSTLAQQYLTLARNYQSLKQWAEAITLIELGTQNGKDLVDKSPRTIAYQETYGDCESAWGEILVAEGLAATAKDRQAARKCFEAAEGHLAASLKTRERLSNGNRDVVAFRSKLALAFNNLGFVLTKLTRFEEAETYLTRAIEEQKEAVRLQPRNAFYVRRLVNHYASLGSNHCSAGRHAQAAELAATLAELKTGDGRECISAARLLANCAANAERDNSMVVEDRKRLANAYNHQAVENLRQGVGRGYQNRQTLETSIDLRPLRSLPAFHEIVKNIPVKPKTPDDPID